MQIAGLGIPGIPKFLRAPTSCPYLVWETERDWRRYTEEWSELEVNQCAQNREPSRQTDLLTIVTPSSPLTTTTTTTTPPDIYTHKVRSTACITGAELTRCWLLFASGSSFCAACMPPSVSVCFPCLCPCLSLHRNGRQARGGSQPRYSNVPEPGQPAANCSPGLKEALCEGQTDGHRMKTVMIPSNAQRTHTHTHTHTHALPCRLHSLQDVMLCVKDRTNCVCVCERERKKERKKERGRGGEDEEGNEAERIDKHSDYVQYVTRESVFVSRICSFSPHCYYSCIASYFFFLVILKKKKKMLVIASKFTTDGRIRKSSG